MKIDWDKETGKWNIRDIETDGLVHRITRIDLNVPSSLVQTDGGRHGYLVCRGQVDINKETDTATITPNGKQSNG